MKTKIYTLFVLVSILFSACGNKTSQSTVNNGDTLHLDYASLLTIVEYDDYTEVSIDNPWRENSVLAKYLLVPRNSKNPKNLPEGTIVRTPLKRCVVFTTAHAALIEMLGAIDCIGGVADLKYMLLPDIRQRVAIGRIEDCGDAMSPNTEKIVDIEADGIMLSPFDNSGGYGRVEEIGIPIIECADYMETSALGRAEWMKFYGLLFDKEAEAVELFNTMIAEYEKLAHLALQSKVRLSILTERLTGSTWYVPGGKSSISQIIEDANGEYAFANDEHSGSVPLTFETVLDKCGKSDVWIFNHYANEPITYTQFAAEHNGYASFKAFKRKNVYYVNSAKVPYFEEVSFRPDKLLREYIILLHPDLKSKLGELKYYKPLL